jgi:hypothetical protein
MNFYFTLLLELLKLTIGAAVFFLLWSAYKAYRSSLRRQDEERVLDADKELLNQAKNSLEWAYNALTKNGEAIPPKADRLNWQACARHILRQNKIALSISGETGQTVYAEIQEYWRHKFHLALSDASLLNPAYFKNQGEPDWPENIDISSALVVVDFANWQEGAKNPTDGVDQSKMMSEGNCFKGPAGRGLRRYVAELNEIRTALNSAKLTTPAKE